MRPPKPIILYISEKTNEPRVSDVRLSDFQQLDSKCPDLQYDNYPSVWNTTWSPRNRSSFVEYSQHQKFMGVS